jgi:hypothetical protein
MLRLSALPALLVLLSAVGCSDPAPPSFTDAGSSMDATEAEVFVYTPDVNAPEARGRACDRSAQCDDGVPCTMDYCSSDGRCANVPDTMQCDDGVYCNGQESCDLRRGCVRGAPLACDDNDGCTTDRCDETTRACQHAPRDFDRDGDPDIGCRSSQCPDGGAPEGDDAGLCWVGSDCDDRDPRVSGTLPEICADGVDNNCNGFVDTQEPGGCVRPPHDRCDDPLDVSAGGRFTVATAGTTGDYAFRCAGGMLARDAVLRLTLTSPRDVFVSAQSRSGSSLVYLMVQSVCGSTVAADTRECVLGFPSVWRVHSLPPGEYFFLLGVSGTATGAAGDAVVDVQLSDPTPPAANDTCETATVIPEAGGTFRGDLIGVADDVSTRCGGSTPDVLYRITLTEPRDIVAHAVGSMTNSVVVSLLGQCARTPVTLRCDSNTSPSFIARAMPAGTYFIAVEGRALPEYTLTVETAAPTAPPPGDTCASPLPLAAGAATRGSLAPFESDLPLSCNSGSARDAVYTFELTERLDVTVTASGGASDYFYVALQATCGERASERGCRAGAPSRLTLRGLDPGRYFVVVRGSRPADYELLLETRPALAPTAVAGNETCETAQAIPAGGGLYSGDTTMMAHDYMFPCASSSMAGDAVYRYRVDRPGRVLFSTEGSSFDTVLWVTSAATCPGTALPGLSTFQVCNDDGPGIGLSSSLDLSLTPGEYFVHVSGLYTTARGMYFLAVTPSAAAP